MTYFLMVEDGQIIGGSQCISGGNIIDVPVTKEIHDAWHNDNDRYIYNDSKIIENPDYENIKRQKERLRLDSLTLTPADVERALLKAKGWDFDDLKSFLKTKGYTDLQIKAIGVELRASDFFRGAVMGEKPNVIRIVDTIGALLGYSSADMDYLFEHKELPTR